MRVPILGILFLTACYGAPDLQSLYDRGHLDLRDAVAAGPAPPFFRAVVACAFNDQTLCLREANAALDSKPSPDLAAKVYDLLSNHHFVHGRWAEALAALEAAAALRGESEDPADGRAFFRALAAHGPVTVQTLRSLQHPCALQERSCAIHRQRTRLPRLCGHRRDHVHVVPVGCQAAWILGCADPATLPFRNTGGPWTHGRRPAASRWFRRAVPKRGRAKARNRNCWENLQVPFPGTR